MSEKLQNDDPRENELQNNALIESIETTIENGELWKAITMCTSALQGDNSDWLFLALRGSAQYKLGNYLDAIIDYSSSLDKNPKASNVMYFRARAYSQNGDLISAINDYSNSINIDPQADAYYSRAIVKRELGFFPEAIKDLTQAITFGDHTFDVYYILGLCYMSIKNYPQAEQHIKIAVSMEDNNPEAYYNLGLIQDNLGKGDVAVKSYSKAISLDKHYFDAIFNRALLYKKSGNIEKFRKDMRLISKHSKDDKLIDEVKKQLSIPIDKTAKN